MDIGFGDLIDFFDRIQYPVHDPLCRIHFKARQFMTAARAFARKKPIIVYKAAGSRNLPLRLHPIPGRWHLKTPSMMRLPESRYRQGVRHRRHLQLYGTDGPAEHPQGSQPGHYH